MSERYQITHDKSGFPIVVDSHDNDHVVFEHGSLVACTLRAARLNQLDREEREGKKEDEIVMQLAREFNLTPEEVLDRIVREAFEFLQRKPAIPE